MIFLGQAGRRKTKEPFLPTNLNEDNDFFNIVPLGVLNNCAAGLIVLTLSCPFCIKRFQYGVSYPRLVWF